MEPVLELRGITKHFPTHKAVDNVSLAVPRGAFYSLLGPSGCGKTTTLRLVAGFEQPTSGEVLLEGSNIGHLPPYKRNVNTVFQNYALFPHLTVWDNIAFGLQRQGRNDSKRRIADAIDRVRLNGKEDRTPAQLSGGERQRVALARSLVLEPAVLLLDEPLSALDPNLRKQVRAELKTLQRDTGCTFLFITHDQEEALSLSDQIAVMNRGRLEQAGTPQEIYLRPCTRFVASFLGAVNWINGVGVRPEATRIAREAPQGDARSVQAVVENCVFLGNCIHVETRLPSGEAVIAEVPSLENSFAAGESVQMWWHPADELPLPPDVQ